MGPRPEPPSAVADVLRDLRQSVGDVATARTLPPAAYTSEAFAEYEAEAVIRRSWLFVCHVSEVAEEGQFLSVRLGGEPLIVCRDRGQVRVLSAVCQHRGYVLVDEGEQGSARHFRCPYHFWSYGLDGRLEGAPSMTPAHDLDELKRTICLPSLPVEVWNGLVFTTFEEDPAPLAPTLERVDEHVAPYRLEDQVVVDTVTLPDLPFNWKNMQENALEEYHTSYVHKGWHDNAPANRVVHGAFESGDGAIFRHVGLVIPGGEPVPGRTLFPLLPWLPEANRWFFLFLSVPPTLFAVLYPHGAKVFRIVGDGAGRTSLTISLVLPRATAESELLDELVAAHRRLIDVLDTPDIESNSRMYVGLHSEFAPRGPYSPQEASLPQFNQWLLERCLAADAVRS